jgi:hypothetical protein
MAGGGHGLTVVLPGPPCPALLRPAGGPPLKGPYGRYRGGLPCLQAACIRLLPLWAPHAIRLCILLENATGIDALLLCGIGLLNE